MIGYYHYQIENPDLHVMSFGPLNGPADDL